jgi:hypothetical protein
MFLNVKNSCSICGRKFENTSLPAYFPYYVCPECDERAVLSDGQSAADWFRKKTQDLRQKDPFGYKDILSSSDTGPNPVFIDGHKCWRRYRMGSWVTMKDAYNSRNLEEFEINNFRT